MREAMVSTAFAEAVWDEVVLRFGPVGEPARAAHAALIARCAAQSMSAEHAAEVVSARMSAARAATEAGLAAFNRLVAAIEFGGRVVREPVPREEAMDHLLATKLGLAELYHYLAGIAPEADAPDVRTPKETAQLIAEAQADLARWHERRR
jgi:hypothetical protein